MSVWNAVMDDDVETLHNMLRFGEVADLSQLSECGNGLMYMAVARSRRKVVRYLHGMGLDVNAYCDDKGFGTPLFHAIYFEALDIIRDLYTLGVDMDAPCDRFGHPPEKAAEILGKSHLIKQIRHLKTLRDRSSTTITRAFRCLRDRRRYLRTKLRIRSAVAVQRITRGYLARLLYERMMKEHTAAMAAAAAAAAAAQKEEAEKTAAAAAALLASSTSSNASQGSSGSGSKGSGGGGGGGGGDGGGAGSTTESKGWLGWAKDKVTGGGGGGTTASSSSGGSSSGNSKGRKKSSESSKTK